MDRSEQICIEILTQLFGYRPMARDADALVRMAKVGGEMSDLAPSEVEREAAYLVDKGYIELQPLDISPQHKRWRITAAGIDWLREKGIV